MSWRTDNIEYLRVTLYDGDDKEEFLVDTLADLLHWCDEQGEDFERALGQARLHHEAEVES